MTFGIFMAIGEKARYATSISGVGLVLIIPKEFNSFDDAIKYINETDVLPSGEQFYILPMFKYIKPHPKAT